MSELVADCPRCGASRITFDLKNAEVVGYRFDWQRHYEAFCICRNCGKSTVFHLCDEGVNHRDAIDRAGGLPEVRRSVNDLVRIEGMVSIKDRATLSPPDHVPEPIEAAFREAATCIAVACYNAAGAMLRLALDLATKDLMPAADAGGPTGRERRDLGLRLPWLIDHGILPAALRDLSHCIREDGNDGAHVGNLTREDVADMLDFAVLLLERIYTEPERLRLADERRKARRGDSA